MNPDCSFDGGLGLFALRSLAPPTIARTLSQILLPLGPPSGGNLLRLDDVAAHQGDRGLGRFGSRWTATTWVNTVR